MEDTIRRPSFWVKFISICFVIGALLEIYLLGGVFFDPMVKYWVPISRIAAYAFLIFPLLDLFIAWGLWNLKKWSWTWALIRLILSIVPILPSPFSAFLLISLLDKFGYPPIFSPVLVIYIFIPVAFLAMLSSRRKEFLA